MRAKNAAQCCSHDTLNIVRATQRCTLLLCDLGVCVCPYTADNSDTASLLYVQSLYVANRESLYNRGARSLIARLAIWRDTAPVFVHDLMCSSVRLLSVAATLLLHHVRNSQIILSDLRSCWSVPMSFLSKLRGSSTLH